MKQTIASQFGEIRKTIEKDKAQYRDDILKLEKNYKEVKDAITTQRCETRKRFESLEQK